MPSLGKAVAQRKRNTRQVYLKTMAAIATMRRMTPHVPQRGEVLYVPLSAYRVTTAHQLTAGITPTYDINRVATFERPLHYEKLEEAPPPPQPMVAMTPPSKASVGRESRQPSSQRPPAVREPSATHEVVQPTVYAQPYPYVHATRGLSSYPGSGFASFESPCAGYRGASEAGRSTGKHVSGTRRMRLYADNEDRRGGRRCRCC